MYQNYSDVPASFDQPVNPDFDQVWRDLMDFTHTVYFSKSAINEAKIKPAELLDMGPDELNRLFGDRFTMAQGAYYIAAKTTDGYHPPEGISKLFAKSHSNDVPASFDGPTLPATNSTELKPPQKALG